MIVVPSQQGLLDAVIDTDTGNTGLTVITTEFDEAGFPAAQVRSEVSWQVTTSPFAGEYANLGWLFPEGDPLTFQRYMGLLPPFTDVELKVTWVPWQTLFAEAEMEMLTGNEEDEANVIALDVAVFDPLMQLLFEVIWHVTTSPFAGE